MALWRNQPNTYKFRGFIDIPEGNHRVRICRVEVERFTKKRKCFEITLEVSGCHGKLWHHIWYDPERTVECEKYFYPFFHSFGIGKKALAFGLGSGTVAVAAVNLLMFMLARIQPATVLYTINNGGILVLSALFAAVFLKEKIALHQGIGYAMSLASIILLSL